MDSYSGTYGAKGIPLKIVVFIRDKKLFIEVMNQSVQLDPLEQNTFGSEAMGLKLIFDTENSAMKFKQGPYQIDMTKQK